MSFACSVEAVGGDAAHVGKSPPKASLLHIDEPSQKSQGTEPKAFEDVPTDHLIEDLDLAAAHQATLVAQLKVRYDGEGSRSVQKDEEIALLKAQLADARAQVESTDLYAKKLAEEKMSLLAQVSQERATFTEYKATCLWVLKYMEKKRMNTSLGWMSFARLWRMRWRSKRLSCASSVLSTMKSYIHT